MKTIIKTKMVEQTTTQYFADDGKEFTTEEECLRHERLQNKEKLKKEFDKLVISEVSFPFQDFAVESWTTFVEIKNKHDFETINDYYDSLDCFYNYLRDNENEIKFPCKAIICETENYNWLYTDINKLKENTEKALEILNSI